MRLIVEIINGNTYVYTETERHFKKVEPGRQKERLLINYRLLDKDCNLSVYGDNVYTAIPFQKERKRRLNRRNV